MKSTKQNFKLQITTLVYSILFLFTVNLTIAQDTDVTECPYFNVFSTDSTGVVFSLASTNIDATISGVIANVVVEQLYLNAGDSTIDATYVFRISAQIWSNELHRKSKRHSRYGFVRNTQIPNKCRKKVQIRP